MGKSIRQIIYSKSVLKLKVCLLIQKLSLSLKHIMQISQPDQCLFESQKTELTICVWDGACLCLSLSDELDIHLDVCFEFVSPVNKKTELTGGCEMLFCSVFTLISLIRVTAVPAVWRRRVSVCCLSGWGRSWCMLGRRARLSQRKL